MGKVSNYMPIFGILVACIGSTGWAEDRLSATADIEILPNSTRVQVLSNSLIQCFLKYDARPFRRVILKDSMFYVVGFNDLGVTTLSAQDLVDKLNQSGSFGVLPEGMTKSQVIEYLGGFINFDPDTAKVAKSQLKLSSAKTGNKYDVVCSSDTSFSYDHVLLTLISSGKLAPIPDL